MIISRGSLNFGVPRSTCTLNFSKIFRHCRMFFSSKFVWRSISVLCSPYKAQYKLLKTMPELHEVLCGYQYNCSLNISISKTTFIHSLSHTKLHNESATHVPHQSAVQCALQFLMAFEMKFSRALESALSWN
uniref:(northern house mosquito) hypothetical protein n=1 Tax=Culex pipiens TaxID=7175 RepID=A0A8D8AKS6_CULPI